MRLGGFRNAENVLFLDLGAGYIRVMNCEHSLSCVSVIGVLFCMYTTLQ